MARLILTRRAYAHLHFLATEVVDEVACFGIAKSPNEPFYIQDFKVLPAEANSGSVVLTDTAMAEWLYELHQRGLVADQAFRVYFHTQPVDATPSSTDYKTFFTDLLPYFPWLVMGIISFDTKTISAVLGSLVGGEVLTKDMSVEIDWGYGWPIKRWKQEIEDTQTHRSISKRTPHAATTCSGASSVRTANHLQIIRAHNHLGDSPSPIDYTEADPRVDRLPINANNPLNAGGIVYKGRLYTAYEFDLLHKARIADAANRGSFDADDPILLEGERAKELRRQEAKDAYDKAKTIITDSPSLITTATSAQIATLTKAANKKANKKARKMARKAKGNRK